MFVKRFRRSSRVLGKSPRKAALQRRLAVELLERRAMLSSGPGSIVNPLASLSAGNGVQPGSAAQQQTLADLPVAEQQAITAAIAQDQAASGPLVQAAKLTASDGTLDDSFGWSVSVSGNTVVVGAPTLGQGAVYVFTDSASGMTQVAKLTASNAQAEWFGSSVAISGNTVAVGAWAQGVAYVFTEPASGWTNMTQTAELTASDATVMDFGWSIAISGRTVVVGASSAAYVFTEPASGWVDMTQTARLTAPGGGSLGRSSVSIDGNTVVAGGQYALQGPGDRFTLRERRLLFGTGVRVRGRQCDRRPG